MVDSFASNGDGRIKPKKTLPKQVISDLGVLASRQNRCRHRTLARELGRKHSDRAPTLYDNQDWQHTQRDLNYTRNEYCSGTCTHANIGSSN